MGEMLEIAANGGPPVRGWLARPAAGKANGKGVIVIQEWWGLVPHIQDVADRFAAEGYAAFAPDLWDGTRATNPDEAGRLLMALDIDRAATQIRASIRALREQAGIGDKVGVVGFCMGGQLALFAATRFPEDIGAAVDFYGIHPKVSPDFSRLSGPVLGHFGEKDPMVTPDVARALEEKILAAGKPCEMHHYPASHAFFNDARPEVYDAASARLAWDRTLSFLAANT